MTRRRTVLQYGTAAVASAVAGLTGLNPLVGSSGRASDRDTTADPPTETPTPTATTTTPEPTPVLWETRVGDWSTAIVTGRGVVLGSGRRVSLLDGATGDASWQYETDDDLAGGFAAADGTVFGTSEAGDVFALDLGSGTEQWETEVDVLRPEDVAVRGDSVFVGGYHVYELAVDGGSVEQEWYLGGDGLRAAIAADDERIYLPRSNAALTAFTVETGEAAWRFETADSYTAPEMTSAVATGERVFAASRDGTVYALDPATGAQQWATSVDDGARVYGIANGHLLVERYDSGRGESTLLSLAPASGDRNWRFERDEHALSRPTVDGESLYVADDTGTVYLLDLADASERRTYRVGSSLAGLVVGTDRLYCFDDDVLSALTKSLEPE